MSFQDSLIKTRDAYATELANFVTGNPSQLSPKYSINGETVDVPEYCEWLRDQIQKLNVDIAMADGGFEVRSTGTTGSY